MAVMKSPGVSDSRASSQERMPFYRYQVVHTGTVFLRLTGGVGDNLMQIRKNRHDHQKDTKRSSKADFPIT